MSMNDGLRLVDPLSYSEHGYPHDEWAELRREAPGLKHLPIRNRLAGGGWR